MRALKTVGWILLWLLVAALLTAAFSLFIFRRGTDSLFEIGPIPIHISGVGAGLGFLTTVLIGAMWQADRKKRTDKKNGAADFLQAAGFGLLPGAAVWSIFLTGNPLLLGREVFQPIPEWPWLTENGLFCPARIEMIFALTAFLAICLWLAIRKNDPARDGSVLMVSAGSWAMIRIITESFRGVTRLTPGGCHILRYVACAVIMICLGIWTMRRNRQHKSTSQTLLDWLAVIACMTVIVLTSEGVLTLGSDIGDFAVIAGAAGLSWVVTLTAAADAEKE